MLAQNETRLQLTASNGNTTVIEPATLTGTRSITVPDVSGTFFIVPASGSSGTLNQLARFGTTGTVLDGSLSDDGAGILSRGGSLTLSVTSLNVTGQTTLNSGTGGSYSLPTTRGRNYDALTSDGAGTASFNPVPPVGSMIMFAGGTAPSGYFICDGSAVSRTTYADLFAVIGVTYGVGNGSSTFNLPDMRGRNPVGAGTGSGLTARTLGTQAGSETHTLSVSEMPSHDHTGSTTSSAGGHSHAGSTADAGGSHSHSVPGYNTGTGTDGIPSNSNTSTTQNDKTTSSSGSHSHSLTITTDGAHTHTITVASQGGGNAHTIMDPFTVVNFIIKY